MFTGIVQCLGEVKKIIRSQNDMQIAISPLAHFPAIQVGESISVDGVCLTVTEVSATVFFADVSGETLSRTTLSFLKSGNRVNLERALRLSDRLGGHLVSGHVDCMGIIQKKTPIDKSWILGFKIDKKISRYIVEKGSVAIDGISLTVNSYGNDFFDVNIIPQTGQSTTLLSKAVGSSVNIETDIIGKYVEKLIGNRKMKHRETETGIDMQKLIAHGFGE